VDRVANGTRSRRQEATKSRREGRRHETRKSRVDHVPCHLRIIAESELSLLCHAHGFVIANNFLSQDGATPLFKAAHKGHTAVIGELLKYRPSLGVLPVRVGEEIDENLGRLKIRV